MSLEIRHGQHFLRDEADDDPGVFRHEVGRDHRVETGLRASEWSALSATGGLESGVVVAVRNGMMAFLYSVSVVRFYPPGAG